METAQRAQSRRKAGDSRPVAAGKPSQTGIQVLPNQAASLWPGKQCPNARAASPRWRVLSPAR